MATYLNNAYLSFLYDAIERPMDDATSLSVTNAKVCLYCLQEILLLYLRPRNLIFA